MTRKHITFIGIEKSVTIDGFLDDPITMKLTKKKSRRGFAGMNPQKRSMIASLGGKAAHERGTAHEWDSKTAKAAGALSKRKKEDNEA